MLAISSNVYPAEFQYYDPFNPAARRIYWRQMSRNCITDGIDGWWLDASEPELSAQWGQYGNYYDRGRARRPRYLTHIH